MTRCLCLFRRWQSSLASDRLKVISWFRGRNLRTRENRSADEKAFSSGTNQLALTSTIVVKLKDIDAPIKPRLGLSRKSRSVLLSQSRIKLSNLGISDKAWLP